MKLVLNNLFSGLNIAFPENSFEVEFWDGTKKKYGQGENKFRLILKNKESIKRVLRSKSLGFGEEFTKGNIIIEGDLQCFLILTHQVKSTLHFSLKDKLRILYNYFFSPETVSKAKENVGYHYDLGNDFYFLWLDETLTYSSAYFRKENDTLKEAQLNKYHHISKKLQLKKGETLIDIGCGWGGMIFYATENFGVKCEGYTLSENQYSYLKEKIKEKGLEDFIKIHLKDYRKAEGKFDKFVSLGMFEHVGKKFYPVFFKKAKELLKPKGIGLLETVGSYKDKPVDKWITKYIFPGVFTPTLSMITEPMSKNNLVFFDIEDLRIHYAKTLDCWAENFEKNLDKIKPIIRKKFNDINKTEEFIKMWRLYLNGCSVSFKTGSKTQYQVAFTRDFNNKLPLTREYIYK